MAVDQAFVDASQQDYPVVDPPIAVDPAAADGEVNADATPPDPRPCMRTYSLPSGNTVVLIVGPKPYRRDVTIVQFEHAITIELSYDQDFRTPDTLFMSGTNFIIPVFAGQYLFARQNTSNDQDISILIEPRGEGR